MISKTKQYCSCGNGLPVDTDGPCTDCSTLIHIENLERKFKNQIQDALNDCITYGLGIIDEEEEDEDDAEE